MSKKYVYLNRKERNIHTSFKNDKNIYYILFTYVYVFEITAIWTHDNSFETIYKINLT